MSGGFVGAGGVAGMQDALRQRILDQETAKRQQFDQMLQLRGANRADEALAQNERLRQDAAAATLQQQGVIQGEKFNESIPGGTEMRAEDPRVRLLRMGGASLTDKGIATPEPPSALAANPDAPPTDMPGTIANAPMLRGRLVVKGESAAQGNTRTDNEQKALDAKNRQEDWVQAGKDKVTAEAKTNQEKIDAAALARQQQTDMAKLVAGLKPPKDTSVSDNARLDRSFNARGKELTDLRKPLADRADKITELEAQLNAGTPQADALVAPKLLSVMVGGAGSGLRMNEAEISRVVGGRSNWETLKASMNKWALDPSQANSITPAQRQQMRSLVASVKQHTNERLDHVNKANDELIDAGDVDSHRRIVSDLRRKLDSGGNTDTGGPKQGDVKTFPNGVKGVFDGQGWVKQ